ncbi:MAG: tetratricopeptide repeat protein, partial [Anaerolineae bacterium]
VKAFRHGRVASEFVGAIPEPKIREFLRNLLPNEADRLAAQGAAAEGKNQTSLAETAYQQALSQQANHPLATLGLARIRLAQGQTAAAETLLQRLPPTSPQAIEGRRLLIRTRWRAEAGQLGDEAAILARLADTDNGLADRIALGKLRLSQERYPEGLDILLTALRADRRFQESAAHKALLDAFSFLGDENPLTITYRRQLSTALF